MLPFISEKFFKKVFPSMGQSNVGKFQKYQYLNMVELWKKIYKCSDQLLDIVEKRRETCKNEKILEEFGVETEVR